MVSTLGFEHWPQFGGGQLLLPLITLAPLGLGHKATKGSVEFNVCVLNHTNDLFQLYINRGTLSCYPF